MDPIMGTSFSGHFLDIGKNGGQEGYIHRTGLFLSGRSRIGVFRIFLFVDIHPSLSVFRVLVHSMGITWHSTEQ